MSMKTTMNNLLYSFADDADCAAAVVAVHDVTVGVADTVADVAAVDGDCTQLRQLLPMLLLIVVLENVGCVGVDYDYERRDANDADANSCDKDENVDD